MDARTELVILLKLKEIDEKLDRLLEQKKPKKRTTTKVEYPDWFEELWEAYPKRAGSNPKNKAYSAISARLAELQQPSRFHLIERAFEGTKRYSDYCDATGKTGTELVMQAQRFYGVNKEYSNGWAIPKQVQQQNLLPKSDDDLAAFAVKMKLHPPGCAPQHLRNNSDYRKWIQERL